jgi:glycosyltransferase involved in cell wall biosynthesis
MRKATGLQAPEQNKRNVLQVAVDCTNESGGMLQAVRDFQRALGGGILSFTSPSLIPPRGSSEVIHVPTREGPIGSRYGITGRGLADATVAANWNRPQLVVVHGLYRQHTQWASDFAAARQIPYWVVPHGALDPWVFSYRRFQKKAWMKLVGSRILRRAQYVILATKREREKAGRHLTGSRNQVVHWPIRRLSPLERSEAATIVRTRLGVGQNARILLFLGRLHPMKRVIETMEAVSKAGDPRTHLVIVGPSSSDLSVEDCRSRATALGMANIHVVGASFGPDKERWLLGADGFISLSHRENFNYAAGEALAAGLPVILSPGNDLAYELAGVRAGWLLHSFAPEEEIEAIRAFGKQPADDLRAMGVAGKDWADSELSEEAFVRVLQGLSHTDGPKAPVFHS